MTTLLFKSIAVKIATCQHLDDSLTDYLQSEDPELCEHLGMVMEALSIESNQLEILCLAV